MYRAAGRQRGGAGARARIPHARRPILRGNPPPQLTPPARLRTAPRLLAATRPQARRSGSPPEPGRHGRRPKGAPASRRAASWAPRPRPRSARPGRAPSAAPCTARPRRCSSRCARCGRGHQAVSAAGACLCGACPRGHYCLCVQTGSSGGLRHSRQAGGRAPTSTQVNQALGAEAVEGPGVELGWAGPVPAVARAAGDSRRLTAGGDVSDDVVVRDGAVQIGQRGVLCG